MLVSAEPVRLEVYNMRRSSVKARAEPTISTASRTTVISLPENFQIKDRI